MNKQLRLQPDEGEDFINPKQNTNYGYGVLKAQALSDSLRSGFFLLGMFSTALKLVGNCKLSLCIFTSIALLIDLGEQVMC